MTISSNLRKAGPFAGNAATTAFPFAYKVFAASDVVVTKSDGTTETTPVLTTDYTVALNADQNANPGGTVTYPASGSPLPVGQTLTLSSSVPELQSTSITNQGGFYPKIIEDALDRLTIFVQQFREILGRSLRFPVSDPALNITLPTAAQRASKLLGFDASGNVTAVGPYDNTLLAAQLADSSDLTKGATLIGYLGGTLRAYLNQFITSAGASLIGWIQYGSGAVTRLVQDKLCDTVSVKDFTGADPTGTTDSLAAFNSANAQNKTVIVPDGTWKLSANVTTVSGAWQISPRALFTGAGKLINKRGFNTGDANGVNIWRFSDRAFFGDAVDATGSTIANTWITQPAGGIFGYFESTPTALSLNRKTGFAWAGAACTSVTAGVPSDVAIGMGSFAYNDKTTGTAGAWALYGTALRAATVAGATHAMELDIANAGALAQIYPNGMFPSGATMAAWIGSGGEATATPGLVGVSSCAIGIISNDPAAVARFDKGIVFHNKSIAGTDGATGSGIAIAFAKGHVITWYNNSNQQVGSFFCSTATAANGQKIELSDSGMLVTDPNGAPQFRVNNGVASAVNYLMASGATTGQPAALSATGSDANIDLALFAQGTGTLKFGTYTAGAVAQAGYITIKDTGGTVRRLLVG